MDIQLLSDLNTLELVLISTISFLGSFFHRFWQFIYNRHSITINTWFAIITNTVIVSIITYSLDPLITSIHPRFIILPPLLMGLVGEELINKLIHIESSLGFIDWFLKYFKLKNPDSESLNIKPDEEYINKDAKYQELLTNIIEIYNKIMTSIDEYNRIGDSKVILTCYRNILMDISLTQARYKQFAYKDDIIGTRYNEMMDAYKCLLNLKQGIYNNGL